MSAPAAKGCSDAAAARPTPSSVRRAPPMSIPARARFASSSSSGSSSGRSLAGKSGVRGRRPAARWAETIEPADVPTKPSHSRKSMPEAASIPASTPVIHASPIRPPPARTSTSGRENGTASA